MGTTGIIYKAMSPSGKVYIGQTTKTLKQRKKQHCYRAFNKNCAAYSYTISGAIRKYGISNMQWIIIHRNIPVSLLDSLEKKEIKKHNSFYSGYNSTEGGEGSIGFSHSKETKKFLSESHKGYNNPFYGRSHSEKTRSKISKAVSGKNNPIYGKQRSDETKRKIAKAVSKLNFEIAEEIRVKYSTKKYSQIDLAHMYDVSGATISLIVNHLLWNK